MGFFIIAVCNPFDKDYLNIKSLIGLKTCLWNFLNIVELVTVES